MKLLLLFLAALSCFAQGVSPSSTYTTTGAILSSQECGMKMNGSTNDASALSNCISSLLPSTGGMIDLGCGSTVIGTTVTITKNNVRIRGCNGAAQMDLNSPYSGAATILNCTASPCIVWQGATPGGSPYNQNFIYGPSLTDLVLDGGNSSAIALKSIDGESTLLDNVTIRNFTGDYALQYTSDVAKTSCSSRLNTISNVWIGTNNGTSSAASGVRFGDSAGLHEVCSNSISNLHVGVSERPGTHQLFLDYTDTNQFSNLWLNGAGGTIKAISSISVFSGVATVSATGHGIPAGTSDGVYIIGGCTSPVDGGGNCSATQVPQLTGSLLATYVDANTFTVPTPGLANGTYFAWLVGGSSLHIGANSSANMSAVYTLNGVTAAAGAGPVFLGGWNWYERCGITPTCGPSSITSPYARLPVGVTAVDAIAGGLRYLSNPVVTPDSSNGNTVFGTASGFSWLSSLNAEALHLTIGSTTNTLTLKNLTDNSAYLRISAGLTGEQEEGIFFFSPLLGTDQWSIRKNVINQWQLIDVTNSRVLLQATKGASSRIEAPNSIILSSLTASSNLCLDGSKVITTSGCTGGGGTVNSGTSGDLGYYATSGTAISDASFLNYNGSLLTSSVPLVLPNGSGGLRIKDAGGTAVNVLSTSGTNPSTITNFGAYDHFEWFVVGTGLIATLSNTGQLNTAGPIGAKVYTVGTMPVCNGTTVSTWVEVSDQNIANLSWGDSPTAGGTSRVAFHCNSVAWTLFAK